MKNNGWITLALILVFLAGLSLVLYPSFSDYWNANRQTVAIASYVDEITGMDPELKEKLWSEAEAYNADLLERPNIYTLTAELRERYPETLDASDNGIMAYVEIPSLDVLLPIYHGTDEGVLQRAVGHLDWTGLPVGGESTHCVISGHRGLPSARLFTDLPKLKEGEVFMLHVLDETLTYEVDQSLVVEPEDVYALNVTPGEDLCTLVTCTPLGVNSHRMLVRGHRVENVQEEKIVRIVSEAMQIDPMVVAPIVAVPLLLLLLIGFLADDAARSNKKKKKKIIR